VQERRNAKRVPNGLPIHDYVNLYFDARNPMMYSRLNRRGELVIVRVDPAVMSQPGAIITDGNAASESTLFLPSPAGLVQLDESLVYATLGTIQTHGGRSKRGALAARRS